MTAENDKTRFIVFTAMMTAVCFAATYINIRFSLGGASSTTMIHLGSAACFLTAMLMGPLAGGIASGIGMGLFDLLNGYAMTSPWTVVIKFLTGFAVGKIAYSHGKSGNSQKTNLVACLVGGVVSLIGYAVSDFTNTIIQFYIPGSPHTGSAVLAGLITAGSGMVGSVLTTLLAIIIALPLNDSIKKALGRSQLQI